MDENQSHQTAACPFKRALQGLYACPTRGTGAAGVVYAVYVDGIVLSCPYQFLVRFWAP